MTITVITLFPEMFAGPLDHSIVARACTQNKVTVSFVNFRDFATDRHKSVDDTPYGGGKGMIIRPDIAVSALEQAGEGYKILLTPQGTTLNHRKVVELSKEEHLILLCGRYEGVDERVKYFVDEELSIGNYVLTGGELAAMVIIDAVTRQLPGVLPTGALTDESFNQDLLEYPQYTKPLHFRGHPVPDVLLSGNHRAISTWRNQRAQEKTAAHKQKGC